MLVALLNPVVLGAALRVQGAVTCPEPMQVAADLQQIIDVSSEYAPKLHAELVRESAWLEVTLTDTDGNSLGERRIDASEDCAVLSHTVAVVLATWLSDEHPEYLVALPPSSGAPVAAPPAAARPATAAVFAPAAPRVATPKSLKASVARGADARHGHRAAFSAALGGAVGSAEFAPAAWLGVSLDPGAKGFGVDLTVAWVADRAEPLAAREVSWTRWPALLGPYLRWVNGVGSFDLGAGSALGWLRLEGQNFSTNIATSHATFGGYAALRFMPKAGTWQPFLMAVPVLWFGRAAAVARASATNETLAETQLPSLDLFFSVGIRFLP